MKSRKDFGIDYSYRGWNPKSERPQMAHPQTGPELDRVERESRLWHLYNLACEVFVLCLGLAIFLWALGWGIEAAR